MQAPLPRNAKVMGWASFGNDLASEMIVPLLAVSFFSFSLSKSAIGIIEGTADAIASMLKLFSGIWADRTSNRLWLIIIGYGFASLLRPMLGFATNWWHVFFVRVGDRFGKGLRTAPRDALLTDSTPPEQRGAAFGFHRAMDHAGAVLGPLIAAWFLWQFPGEHQWLMFLTVIPGLCVLALVIFGLKEVPRTIVKPDRFRFMTRELPRSFWWFIFAIGLFALGCSSDLFLLLRLKELGVHEALLPILWAVLHVFKAIGNLWIGRWADRGNSALYVILGWIWYAVVYLLMAWLSSPWGASIVFVLYAGFYALTEPTEKKIISELVPAHVRGQAFGWYHFVTGIMIFPASALFGWLYESYSAWYAFGFGAGCAAISSLLLFILWFQPRRA